VLKLRKQSGPDLRCGISGKHDTAGHPLELLSDVVDRTAGVGIHHRFGDQEPELRTHDAGVSRGAERIALNAPDTRWPAASSFLPLELLQTRSATFTSASIAANSAAVELVLLVISGSPSSRPGELVSLTPSAHPTRIRHVRTQGTVPGRSALGGHPMLVDRRSIRCGSLAAALVLLLASCSGSKQPVSAAKAATRGDVTFCAKYKDNTTSLENSRRAGGR
jgi:hypothetical protein